MGCAAAESGITAWDFLELLNPGAGWGESGCAHPHIWGVLQKLSHNVLWHCRCCFKPCGTWREGSHVKLELELPQPYGRLGPTSVRLHALVIASLLLAPRASAFIVCPFPVRIIHPPQEQARRRAWEAAGGSGDGERALSCPSLPSQPRVCGDRAGEGNGVDTRGTERTQAATCWAAAGNGRLRRRGFAFCKQRASS